MVSRVLLILGLLLVLAPSAGGANQHERRTATLLYGVPSDGFQSCFAPFLHRQVEYQLNANAAWGFGLWRYQAAKLEPRAKSESIWRRFRGDLD